MAETGLHRPKQPQVIRERLLSACVELLAEGVPLSIGEVATLAGVTKGAVQHHFGTREALLMALYDELERQFVQQVQTAGSGLSAAGAYVVATVNARSDAELSRSWRALLVACVIDRALATRWSTWTQANRQLDGDGVNGKMVARLAADGLWLSDMLATNELTATARESLRTQLLQLSEKEPG